MATHHTAFQPHTYIHQTSLVVWFSFNLTSNPWQRLSPNLVVVWPSIPFFIDYGRYWNKIPVFSSLYFITQLVFLFLFYSFEWRGRGKQRAKALRIGEYYGASVPQWTATINSPCVQEKIISWRLFITFNSLWLQTQPVYFTMVHRYLVLRLVVTV